MRRAWNRSLAAAQFGLSILYPILAAELPRDAIEIDYAKSNGLVAAAYQGGQVVVWEFESARVKNVFNAAGVKSARNKPLGHFSGDGKRFAFTSEGEAGLTVYDLEHGASTVVVPHRLLYLGIQAFTWSHQDDVMLVAIGRDVALVTAAGRVQWQRRLETRSIITDVAWHPSERFYTVATDDATVSSYDTVSGRVMASATLEGAPHATPVKISWTPDGSALAAVVAGQDLALLDPDSLKTKKTIPCHCADFDWSGKKELAAVIPPSVLLFSEAGQRTHEIKTAFDAPAPVVWVDEGHILTGSSDSAVVLREARGGKILRTFSPPR